jgi:phosphotransferase system HPr (HPr) family protein
VITFEVNEKRVNAKSIMGVMALASQDSPKIKIYADGEDEEEAVKKIASLLG